MARADMTRREILGAGAAGLAAFAFGPLVLRAGAEPTEPSGDLGAYGDYGGGPDTPGAAPAGAADEESPAGGWGATEPNILGPFHREGAPFRAKVTPPLEPGDPLLVRGRIWGADSRAPIPRCTVDIWQANDAGRYDNDDPAAPPAPDVFLNRTRLVTDESGRYEYETILPGRYRIGPDVWRPRHIHYWVRHDRYRPLVTQLYFRGDPHNGTDRFVRPSLIMDLQERTTPRGAYRFCTFDIVLAPA